MYNKADTLNELEPSMLKTNLTTPWTDQVNPELPWPEYPRPQMVRERWLNLNGRWELAVTPRQAAEPTVFPEQILVPFPIESALSGLQRQLLPSERLWYRRTFTLPEDWAGGRVLLHFGAVDWECQARVNGQTVGEHWGGYDPFTFDITAALQPGENELNVTVWDPSDTARIQRGKQTLRPGFIWYTPISGIWQTVWLESVPQTYLQALKLTPDPDRSSLTVEAVTNAPGTGLKLKAKIGQNGEWIAEGESEADKPLTLPIDAPRLWTPEDPFLYDLELNLLQDNEPLDHVCSYFGMRKFSLEPDSRGTPRFCLNGKPLFLYGPLDQGYWPDGLYTPPSDEALRWEVDFIKQAGFNMVRKHIKIEPARYYAYCDRVGLIVWQDMISGAMTPRPIWFGLAKLMRGMRDDRLYWRLGRGRQKEREQFEEEYQRMIDALYNVVSIAIWGPFNEGWGQFDAARITDWTKTYDPTRLVDHASGWFDQGAGDFKSEHIYFKPLPASKFDGTRALVISEFGGYSLNLPGHTWNPNKDFGYKKFRDEDALTDGYLALVNQQLLEWARAGCSAAVYTQTTDVETEVNGFLTYDRRVVKMDLDRIRTAHLRLYEESPD
jgi:beta-galactosidase/beta-glucuronidase